MKKTPILLSTLALATGVSGITNAALSLVPPVSALEVATTDVDQYHDVYVDDLYEMNQYFRINELDFQKNRIVYDVRGNYTLIGVRAQRALIVMRDYEAGVTEAEANERSKTLGVSDEGWYQTLVNNKTVAATNYAPIKDYDLKNNLSDVLYFAIQFGELTTDENGKKVLQNEYWVRGKVDYRKCIHSDLFDAETMVCAMRINNNAKTAVLAAIENGEWVMFPEDERVITWEEEWKLALKDKIAGLNTQLKHMDTQLSSVDKTLIQVATTIKNMQKSMGELKDTQELEQGLTQLQALLKQVQKTHDWMIGAEQKKVMDNLQETLNDALAEIERLKQQSTGDMGEVSSVQKELVRLQAEIQALQAKLTEANSQLGQEKANTESAKQELEQIEIKMKKILVEKEENMQKLQILTNDKMALEQENTKLKQENVDLMAQNLTLNTKIKELEAALAEKPVCTVITEVKADVEPGVEGNKSATVETASESTNMAETEVVEVPNLGEVETKTNFWWIVAAAVGVLGVLGVCCKKCLNRGR